jgi:thiol-disulfide isomerase/thioredoxin
MHDQADHDLVNESAKMFKSLMSLTRWLAVGLFFCFAVALQAQPARPAKQISQAGEVFSLDPVKALKKPPHIKQPCCFCGAVVPFTLAGRPYFSSVNSPGDIREINLDDLKKIIQRDPKDTRPLLINFWATWCDPCREEFPDLVKVDADYRSKGLNFVAVSLDDISDIKTVVPKFLTEMKATMPVVLLNVNDPEPAIKAVDAGWDGQLPATFLYDKEGKVVFKHFGKIDAAELRAAIDKTVGSKQ